MLNPGGEHEQDTVIEGNSDIFGLMIARYQAEDHAAEEQITFSIRRPAIDTTPELIGKDVSRDLLIGISGLVQITHENAPLAFRDGGLCRHDPIPHWLTPRTRTRVMTMAAMYHYRTGRLLSINDGSLPYGGAIAHRRVNVGADLCHGSHRQGVDIDFNQKDMQVGEPGNEPDGVNIREVKTNVNGEMAPLLVLLDSWAERMGGSTFHTTASIHYRFPD